MPVPPKPEKIERVRARAPAVAKRADAAEQARRMPEQSVRQMLDAGLTRILMPERFGGYGLDPTISRYDQTSDPLQWARERVALIDWLVDSLDTRVVAPGQGYGRLRSAFTDLLTDRWYALLITTKYLGGATIARDHRGDPDARPSFETVPADRQREALGFLAEAGFGENAYRFRPELLSRLGPDRWMHWGVSPASGGRPDFPVHDWALAQQRLHHSQRKRGAPLPSIR